MIQYNIEKLDKKLKKELDHGRYWHSLGVMYTAAALAMQYGCDLNAAMTAGLLHDCAKCIPNDRKIEMCEKYAIPVSEIEKKAPYLLHSKLGAYLAKTKYGVEDEEILNAIRWHTTGCPDMTLLEKIIYLADYIEPGRNKAEDLPLVRKLAFQDIDMAVYVTLRDTVVYLDKGMRSSETDPQTWRALHYYEGLMEEQSNSPEMKHPLTLENSVLPDGKEPDNE